MFTCLHCNGQHHYADTARACQQGYTSVCTDLVQVPAGSRWEELPDDEEGGYWWDWDAYQRTCGATAISDERGYHCEAGHDHVNLQTRLGEGWDYAGDEAEAAGRASYGYASVLPDGKPYIG